MLETEKATSWSDLPHDFLKRAKNVCLCGRPRSDEIHTSVLTRQAAHDGAIITEKGI